MLNPSIKIAPPPRPLRKNPRGIEKRGGTVMLNAHVEKITTDPSGRADGVVLRGRGGGKGGERVRANKAVVTNASVGGAVKREGMGLLEGAPPMPLPPTSTCIPCSQPPSMTHYSPQTHQVWDSLKLVEGVDQITQSKSDHMKRAAEAMPPCPSFMHLHIGFDATGGFEAEALAIFSIQPHAVCLLVIISPERSNLKAADESFPSSTARRPHIPGLEGLELHHIVVNSWERGVDAEQNVRACSLAG
jgi:hypothetical protein